MVGKPRRVAAGSSVGSADPRLAVAEGRAIVYGRNPVREAGRGRRRLHRAWAADGGTPVVPAGVPLEEAAPDELTRLAASPDHQGIVAEVDAYPYADPATMLAEEEALVIALDQVQDPGNLGAICRTAEVAGASGVVIPARRAAAVTPAVCKASAGAVEHLSLARVTNLVTWLEQAKQQGAWIHGAQAGADAAYLDVDLSGPTVLVLGGEAKGLRPLVAKACDTVVAIPQHGRIGALNVSAAAAVLIFEALRQRGIDG